VPISEFRLLRRNPGMNEVRIIRQSGLRTFSGTELMFQRIANKSTANSRRSFRSGSMTHQASPRGFYLTDTFQSQELAIAAATQCGRQQSDVGLSGDEPL
jgi:hypothetical protein